MKFFARTLALIFATCFVKYSSSSSVDDNMRISHKEKTTLDKFRKMMQPYLYTNYMKEDIYLIHWLRAKSFNLENSKQMLLDNLRWRKANKIDTITSENWSDMHADYPIESITHDKQGRPVVTVYFGLWNLRQAAINGKMPRLLRYESKLLEEAALNIQQNQYQGKNVTQCKVILDLDGFNVVEHGCPACIQAGVSLLDKIQKYYTGYTEAFILINTPDAFEVMLSVMRPMFTERAKKILKIFGTNKKEWMAYLDKEISKDQRTPEHGGTKSD